MCWIEAKHRRSEEKVERLQTEEIEKISLAKEQIFIKVSELEYDNYGLSKELVSINYLYLSKDALCSDYGCDTYRLAKEASFCGRILKVDTISPTFLRQHGLFEHLSDFPASHIFSKACNYSSIFREAIGIDGNYEYNSCSLRSLAADIKFQIKNFSYLNMIKGPLPKGVVDIMSVKLPVISEKDYLQVRTLFLSVAV